MKHLIALLLLVAVLGLSPRAEALTLSLEPPLQTITVGDPATYTLRISDIADPVFFTDYTIALLFDSSILAFDSVNFITGTGAADSSIPDFLLIDGFPLFNAPDVAPVDLASLTFTGISLGTSDLIIAAHVFSDLTDLNNPVFFEADSVSDAQASVVPEPGTLILLGAGLAGLAVWQRRRS